MDLWHICICEGFDDCVSTLSNPTLQYCAFQSLHAGQKTWHPVMVRIAIGNASQMGLCASLIMREIGRGTSIPQMETAPLCPSADLSVAVYRTTCCTEAS